MRAQDKMVSLDKVLEIVELRIGIAKQRRDVLIEKYGKQYLSSLPNTPYKVASKVLNELSVLHNNLKEELLNDGGN